MTTPGGPGGSEGQQEPTFADVLNNLYLDTGRSRRRRRGKDRVLDAECSKADPNYWSLDPERGNVEQPAAPPMPGAAVEDDWSADPGPDDEWGEPEDVPSVVRPYAWTRGRTRPLYDLAVETLVSTSDHGRDVAALTSVEHRAVAELCRRPRSVAEVAALLSLPLGVARVLLADMAHIGLLAVHRTASSSGDVPDFALMERVLSGLRRL